MAKARTDVTVKVRPNFWIATEIFAPQRPLAKRAWNRCQQVAAAARRNAPYRTGRLRSSIVARKSPDSLPHQPSYEVVAQTHYAAPQEKGFRHYRSGRFIPGKHYLSRANRSVRW